MKRAQVRQHRTLRDGRRVLNIVCPICAQALAARRRSGELPTPVERAGLCNRKGVPVRLRRSIFRASVQTAPHTLRPILITFTPKLTFEANTEEARQLALALADAIEQAQRDAAERAAKTAEVVGDTRQPDGGGDDDSPA